MCFTAWSCVIIDSGVLISDAIGSPRPWAMAAFCLHFWINWNKSVVTCAYLEWDSAHKGGWGGVLWLLSCQQVTFQAKCTEWSLTPPARAHSKRLLTSSFIPRARKGKPTAFSFLAQVFAWAGDVHKPLIGKLVLSYVGIQEQLQGVSDQ